MKAREAIQKQIQHNRLVLLVSLFVLTLVFYGLFFFGEVWEWFAYAALAFLLLMSWYVINASRLLRGVICPHCSQPLMTPLEDGKEGKLIALSVPEKVTSCVSCGKSFDQDL